MYSQGTTRARRKRFALVALFVFAGAGLAALVSFARDRAARRAAHNMANPVPATAQVLAEGKKNYDTHCASCHGVDGDGKGDKAAGLWSKPTDFRSPRLARRTDGDLFWVTTKGNWPMPAFEKKLSDFERWRLVDFIRTYEKQ